MGVPVTEEVAADHRHGIEEGVLPLNDSTMKLLQSHDLPDDKSEFAPPVHLAAPTRTWLCTCPHEY